MVKASSTNIHSQLLQWLSISISIRISLVFIVISNSLLCSLMWQLVPNVTHFLSFLQPKCLRPHGYLMTRAPAPSSYPSSGRWKGEKLKLTGKTYGCMVFSEKKSNAEHILDFQELSYTFFLNCLNFCKSVCIFRKFLYFCIFRKTNFFRKIMQF